MTQDVAAVKRGDWDEVEDAKQHVQFHRSVEQHHDRDPRRTEFDFRAITSDQFASHWTDERDGDQAQHGKHYKTEITDRAGDRSKNVSLHGVTKVLRRYGTGFCPAEDTEAAEQTDQRQQECPYWIDVLDG